ncbi:MAG: ribonuclease H-like domain-containing protein [Candidatus Jorgensenbacteria bacterium]
MSDKLVFDIETKNSFDDVGGQEHVRKLEVSVVGVYSYVQDKYLIFDEHELDKLNKLFQDAYFLVGFSSKRFDIPVLEKHFSFNASAIPHFDILEEVEKSYGRRVGLGVIAEANLGVGKSGHGLQAIELYRNGEMEKLKSYCLQDVRLTKELYELIKKQGFLWIPQRDVPQMAKVAIGWNEPSPPPARLL